MADLVTPVAPVSTFTPNPTVDSVQAKVIEQLTGEEKPQPELEIPLPKKPQDTPATPPPPPAPTEMDRLRKQMQRKEAEYQAAGGMAQRKYEAQIQEAANKIAVLEARLNGQQAPTTDPAKAAPDPFQSKVEKYIAEQSKRQAELEAKIAAQESEKESMAYYTQWVTEANETILKPEFSDFITQCKLEGWDPIKKLTEYTYSQIQQKGITLATDDAAEDLNLIAARKLAEYKKHFGSGSVAQAIADKQIHGLGGAPESGTQGKPTTQQESFDSLLDNLDSTGFFKQG
jgi:hypothetical protein